jgi:hypothetical protein
MSAREHRITVRRSILGIGEATVKDERQVLEVYAASGGSSSPASSSQTLARSTKLCRKAQSAPS